MCHRMAQRPRLPLMAVVEGQAITAFILQSTGRLTFHALTCRFGLAFACLDETTLVRHLDEYIISRRGTVWCSVRDCR